MGGGRWWRWRWRVDRGGGGGWTEVEVEAGGGSWKFQKFVHSVNARKSRLTHNVCLFPKITFYCTYFLLLKFTSTVLKTTIPKKQFFTCRETMDCEEGHDRRTEDPLPELQEESDHSDTEVNDNDCASGPRFYERPKVGEKRAYHFGSRSRRVEAAPSRMMADRVNVHVIALRFLDNNHRVIKCCGNNCLQQLHDFAGPTALHEVVAIKAQYIYSEGQNNAADTLLNELKLGFKSAQGADFSSNYTWTRVTSTAAEKSQQQYWWRPDSLGSAQVEGQCSRVSASPILISWNPHDCTVYCFGYPAY